jgi:carboxyl-terminal processing protease
MIDLEEGIGYIRVSSFRDNTMRDFDEALSRLLDKGIRGLIIDLRFNPGGVMHQGIAMVDRFVEDGVILSTVTRHKAVQEYLATRLGTVKDVRVAVLVNGASASAAEIVAGALQARGRAVVVGERSFGKGSVQHLIRLTEHKAAVKLTVAYYRLPDGRIIHRTAKNTNTDSWGVIPDVEIVLSDEETHAIQQSRRQLDLAFVESTRPSDAGDPSRNCNGAVRTTSRDRKGAVTKTRDRPHQAKPPEIFRDRQLLEALRLLQQHI